MHHAGKDAHFLIASKSQVEEDNIPEENDPVVSLFPEPSGCFAPVWVVLILEHHICHLQRGKVEGKGRRTEERRIEEM